MPDKFRLNSFTGIFIAVGMFIIAWQSAKITFKEFTFAPNKNKYNSYREAVQACKDWVAKGGEYEATNQELLVDQEWLDIQPYHAANYKLGEILKEKTYKFPIRWCDEEKETKQILGLRLPSDYKKDDKKVFNERCLSRCNEMSRWEKNNSKVKANFYY